jgi:hypothetical protein
MVKLGCDPMLRQRLGNAARRVSKPFSEPRIASLWHEVLYGQMPIIKKPVLSVTAESVSRSRAV